MNKLFGERIYQFILSCDIMDEELFHDILELIAAYLKDEFKLECFSVFGLGKVDRRTGLKTIWNTSDNEPAYTIRCQGADDTRKCTTFKGYAYDINQPLWLVDTSDVKKIGAGYVDYWSTMEPQDFLMTEDAFEGDGRPKTLVIHPLTADGQPLGVVEFALQEPLIPTAVTLKEIEQLATVISRAYQMYSVRKRYRKDTKKAIKMLEKAREEESWAHLGRPKLFFAFSGGAELEPALKKQHDSIVDCIKKTLSAFENAIEITLWSEIDELGNITSQIIDTIVNSDFGVAYFSEPSEEGDGKFKDNPNVLFEAGMMQSLANTPGVRFKSWVPIRVEDQQDDDSTLPFDIAGDRIVMVARTGNNGTFKEKELCKDLREKIQFLLDKEDS